MFNWMVLDGPRATQVQDEPSGPQYSWGLGIFTSDRLTGFCAIMNNQPKNSNR